MTRPTFVHRQSVSLRAKIAVACAVAVAASAALLVVRERVARAADPVTRATIAIDGDMGDWAAVLVNPLQTTVDGDGSSPTIKANCDLYSTDRDCPQAGGAGNDLQRFAWTYDDDNVYLYVERFPNGVLTTGVDFFFVADVNRDGFMKAPQGLPGVPDDVIVHARWSPNQPPASSVALELFDYAPEAAGGDPIACGTTSCGKAPYGYVDGYSLPGDETNPHACTDCAGASNTDKLHMEIRLPWTTFGASVTKDNPFNWHVLSANNGHLAQPVDNIGAPSGRLGTFIQRGVSFYPDHTGAALPGDWVEYLHTVVNDGNDTDHFNVSVTDALGAHVQLYAGTTLLAVDDQGDGSWDSVYVNTDAGSGDQRPDVTLLSGASVGLKVRLTMPSVTGVTDTTRITVTSGNDPGVTAAAVDTTSVGAPSISPPAHDSWVVAGQRLEMKKTLVNAQGRTDAFDLTATGCPGYAISFAADAADPPGPAITSTGNLGVNGSFPFWLLVTPPGGTPLGTACTVTVTARSATTGATATATERVVISDAVTLTPDWTPSGAGRARVTSGSSVWLPVVLRNATDSPRAFAVSAILAAPVPAGAGTPHVWSDPDGNGSPNDGAIIATTGTVGAFGGTLPLLVEIAAGTASAYSVIKVETTATSASPSPEVSAIERAEADVGHVGVFRDALHTDGSSVFPPCAIVYAQARGLTPDTTSTYALGWWDGSAVVTTAALVSRGDGSADAEYLVTAGARRGGWQARLAGGGLSEVAAFEVELAGTIAALALDQGRYRPGDAVSVAATVRNDGRALLEGTSLAWSGATTRARTGVSLAAGASLSDPFTFTLAGNAAPGLHPLSLAWQLSCGGASVATRTISVPVAPSAPAITSVTPAPDGELVGTSTPTFAGTKLAAASLTLDLTGPAAHSFGPLAAGGSGWSVQTTPLADGTYRATATQSVQGVPSDPSLAVTIVVDTTAPAAPAITVPADQAVTNVAAVGVSGTAALDATAVRVFVDGVGEAGTLAAADGAFLGTVTLADGDHQLTARARDRAGNYSGASPAVRVSVDTVPPAAPLIAVPAADAAIPGPAPLVAVSGTAEVAPTTVEVTIDELVSLSTTSATATRSGTDFGAAFNLLDGTYRATVIARDRAGNLSPAATRDFTVDSVPPATPTILSPAPGELVNGTTASSYVEVVGTTEPLASVQVDVDALTTTVAANGAGGWSVRLTGLAQGSHDVYATASDRAGNVQLVAAHVAFTLDTIAPDLQVVAPATTILGLAQLPGGILTVSGTAEEDGRGPASVDVTFAGSTHTVTATGGAWQTTFALAALEGGTLDPAGFSRALTVKATDVAGNASGTTTLTLTVDRTAPAGVTGFVPPPAATNLGSVPFGGTVPADAVGVQVFDGATLVTTVPVAGPGPFSFTVPAAEGSHTYELRVVDAAGNASSGVTASVTVDFTAPGATILDPLATPVPSPSLTLGGTAAADGDVVAVVVFDGLTAVTTVAVVPGATFSIPVTAGEGTHDYSARAMDAAGNLGTPSATATVVVDLTPPAAATLAPVSTPTSSTTVTFAGALPSDADVVAVVLFDGTNAVTTVSASPGGAFSIPVTLGEGAHSVTARARDAAGNLGAPSAAVPVVVDTTPPPETPTPNPVPGTSGTGTITFSGTVPNDPDIVGLVVFDGATVVTTVPVTPGAPYSVTITVTEGPHDFRLAFVDRAGNQGPPTPPIHVVVDTTPPAVAPAPNPVPGTSTSGTVTFTGTVPNDPDIVAVIVFDGATVVTTVPVSPGAPYSITIPASEGPHDYRLVFVDAAGNQGPPSPAIPVVVDTIPPAVAPAPNPVPGTSTSGTVTFTGTVPNDPDIVAVIVFDGSTVVTTVPVTPGAPYSVTVPAADGPHDYELVFVDGAGNQGPPSPVIHVDVDTTPPATAATLVGPPSPTNDPELVFTATIPSDASAVALWDGATLVTVVAGSGELAFAIPLPADGDHSYVARPRDAAGNEGPASAAVAITVDTVAPPTPVITSPGAGAAFAPGMLPVRGTAEPGATVTVTVGAGTPFSGVAAGDGTFEVAVPVPEGAHTVSVVATDAAGNASTAATVDVLARNTAGGAGGGGCGCTNAGAAPGLLALLGLVALAPRRRRVR